MKSNILVIGAGSIGNHFTNAFLSISKKYNLFITDISELALLRMKNEIFFQRYGYWHNSINLVEINNLKNIEDLKFEFIIIGTPPFSHADVFNKIVKNLSYQKLIIEKPLHSFKQSIKINENKLIFCGYNHSVSDSFVFFKNRIKNLKKIDLIEVNWREGWSGILKAHFWLKNEFSSYLGNFEAGGGALHEHSHGLHLSLYIMKILNIKPKKRSYNVSFKSNNKVKYDNYSSIHFYDNKKQLKLIYQTDLVSEDVDKSVIIHSENRKFVWRCNYKPGYDFVSTINSKSQKSNDKFFKKDRSKDFIDEISHIKKINKLSHYKNSPLNISLAKDVMFEIKKFFYSLK